jgi:hypothetical protein
MFRDGKRGGGHGGSGADDGPIPFFGSVYFGVFRYFGPHKPHYGVVTSGSIKPRSKRPPQGKGPLVPLSPVSSADDAADNPGALAMAPGTFSYPKIMPDGRRVFPTSYLLLDITLLVGRRTLAAVFEPKDPLPKAIQQQARDILEKLCA